MPDCTVIYSGPLYIGTHISSGLRGRVGPVGSGMCQQDTARIGSDDDLTSLKKCQMVRHLLSYHRSRQFTGDEIGYIVLRSLNE